MDTTNPSANTEGPFSIPDPWKQGLGIFDMSAMKWNNGCDSKAKPYVSPE